MTQPSRPSDARPRRIAIAGVFDIANYGDQLFPLIAAHRLAPHGIEVCAVAPSASTRILPDAMTPQDAGWLLADPTPLDGILIGGGNIIYNLRVDYLGARRADGHWLEGGMHTGIWLAAATSAALRDIPFALNAPGVPYPFSTATQRSVLKPVMDASDYIAVRDTASAALLPQDGRTVHVVPDTAIDIASMWPKASLQSAFATLCARTGLGAKPYFVVHVRCRSDQRGKLQCMADHLDRFAKSHQLVPLLLAIGNDLGDADTLNALSSHMRTPAIVLDDPLNLKEMAASLAHAATYIGGSLHGYVTSLAYGVPGVIVTTQMHRKFAGFLAWAERADDLARHWEDALTKAAAHLRAGFRPQVPAVASDALRSHWARILMMLDAPAKRSAQRAALLRCLTSRAILGAGVDWAMEPWSYRPPGTAHSAPEPSRGTPQS